MSSTSATATATATAKVPDKFTTPNAPPPPVINKPKKETRDQVRGDQNNNINPRARRSLQF
jgi:hypothetical protein